MESAGQAGRAAPLPPPELAAPSSTICRIAARASAGSICCSRWVFRTTCRLNKTAYLQ
jgi:hypothetical protein